MWNPSHRWRQAGLLGIIKAVEYSFRVAVSIGSLDLKFCCACQLLWMYHSLNEYMMCHWPAGNSEEVRATCCGHSCRPVCALGQVQVLLIAQHGAGYDKILVLNPKKSRKSCVGVSVGMYWG